MLLLAFSLLSPVTRAQEPETLPPLFGGSVSDPKPDAPKAKLLDRAKHEKTWLTLSAMDYGATIIDARVTMYDRSNFTPFHEHNPLERPIVHLPQPAYYGAKIAGVTLANFVGLKMKHSHRWYRHAWWLPQTAGIIDAVWGATYSSVTVNQP